VLNGELAPPTSLIRSYPQELERIVLCALAPQPLLRYPTAERMRFALEEFIARGQLVTQSNVAQLVRARIGDSIERRKERIRQVSGAGNHEGGSSEPPGGMTPSDQASVAHRSGVKPSANAARPVFTTMGMERGAHVVQAVQGAPGTSSAEVTLAPPVPPVSSSPHAPMAPVQGMPQPQPLHPGAYPVHGAQAFGQQGYGPQGQGSNAGPMTLPPGSDDRGPDPSGSHAMGLAPNAPAVDPGPPGQPAGAGAYTLAVGIGVLVAVFIAVGGFFAWRGRAASSAEAPVSAGAASAAMPVAVPMTAAPVAVPQVAVATEPPVAAAPAEKEPTKDAPTKDPPKPSGGGVAPHPPKPVRVGPSLPPNPF
jgi:serine/threonine-protein kinase